MLHCTCSPLGGLSFFRLLAFGARKGSYYDPAPMSHSNVLIRSPCFACRLLPVAWEVAMDRFVSAPLIPRLMRVFPSRSLRASACHEPRCRVAHMAAPLGEFASCRI